MNNLEYYKVFYYSAMLESVTEAAKKLNISQPAVSQSLKNLEDTLGVRLFTRASKGIRLTREGQVLYEYVARGCEQISIGEDKIRQIRNLESGEITIGASDMTLQFYLLPFLEHFHDTYPGIKVNVTNAPTPETLKNLEEGKIDFGIISTPFMEKPFMKTIHVREIEDIYVAARHFTSLKNRMLDLKDLEKLPLICLEQNTSSRRYMDLYLEKNDVFIKPEFELATSDMIVQFACRNLGVGCVVRDFAKDHLANGTLFELRFNTMIPKRNICVAISQNTTMSVAAGNLYNMLKEEK